MLRHALAVILASTYVGCASPTPSSIEPARAKYAPDAPHTPHASRTSHARPAASELDSDGDGIADAVDSCTKLEEDFDGVEDGDGCPEKKIVVIANRSIEIGPPGDQLLRTSRREIAFVKPLVFDGGALTSANDEALGLLARVMIAANVEGHVECASDAEARVLVAWLEANGVPPDNVDAVRHSDSAIEALDDVTRAATGRCIVRYSQCELIEHETRLP